MKDEKTEDIMLEKAVAIVKEAIRKQEEEYQKISTAGGSCFVTLEGRTEKGYRCEIVVDPKDVAKIFLEYDYPLWKVLGLDAPPEMWDTLAEYYGLESVEHIDI